MFSAQKTPKSVSRGRRGLKQKDRNAAFSKRKKKNTLQEKWRSGEDLGSKGGITKNSGDQVANASKKRGNHRRNKKPPQAGLPTKKEFGTSPAFIGGGQVTVKGCQKNGKKPGKRDKTE